MTKTKKGVLFIVLPWICLVLTLFLWGVVSFIVSRYLYVPVGVDTNTALRAASNAAMIAKTANLILGIIGFLSVLGIPVGAIVGIIILVKKEPAAAVPSNPVPGPQTPPSNPVS